MFVMLGTVASMALAGCGSSSSIGSGTVEVFTINSPFPAGVSVPFTIGGSGFSTIFGPAGTVRFTASSGTPFAGGTSATADVPGTIVSNGQVTGSSPVPVGVADFTAYVTVILPSGAFGTSATPIATFLVLPPDAIDDAFAATGNVLLTRNAATGVLSNDVPAGIVVTLFDAISANGGDVVVNPDGSFTYDPPPGFTGSDTFTYTVGNGAQTDVATVTITVTEMVWFIDADAAAGGDGRFSGPFDSVAAFNAQQGGGGADDPEAGDWIFVYRRSMGSVPGNLTLLPNQRLIGQGVDLIVNATLIVPSTANTVLEASSTNTVTLALNNTVRGFNLVNTAGGALLGNAIGAFNADTVALTAIGGPALSLDAGTVNAIFSTIVSNGSPNRGVFLNLVSGTVLCTNTTITGAATHGVLVSSSSGGIVFAGLDITGGAGKGLSVIGSPGTVAVTGAVNAILTGTGLALEVVNSGIGAAGLTFRSINSNGAPSGIILTNTSGSGGLTVTGDGTTTPGPGGTIANSVNGGILLSGTHDVSISQCNVFGAGGQGLEANQVRNLTFRRAQVFNTGDANAENNIGLTNVFGTSLIEDVQVGDINENGVAIRNDTTDDATLDTLVIRRLEVLDHLPSAFAEDGVDIQAEVTANLSVTVEDCDVTLNPFGVLGLNATSSGTALLETNVTGTVFNAALAFGSGGIQMVASGTGTTTFRVLNSFVFDSKFTPLIANNEDDVTSFVTISGNTLEGNGLTHNGFGIQIRQDENGSATVLVAGNTINDVGFDGISAIARDTTDGTGTLNLTASANVVGTPTIFGSGVLVNSQDTNTIRTSILGNVLSGTQTSLPFDADIFLLQQDASVLGVTQLAPTGAVNAAEIDDANNGATIGTTGTVTFNAGATPLPPP
jgi:hypothetical protein